MKHSVIAFFFLTFLFVACTPQLPKTNSTGGIPDIFPDYKHVTIPVNIAPLNFRLNSKALAMAELSVGDFAIRIKSKHGSFSFPLKAWRQLLHKAAGDSVKVSLFERKEEGWHGYAPFFLYVRKEPVDAYLVYRRINPGYRMWSEMGIYQRNVENFTEKTILNNQFTHNNCMNCHSFCMQSPEQMVFHQRSTHAGTYLVTKGEVNKLQVNNGSEFSSLVYPYWHPSGRFIAFSNNNTKQDFHLSSPNRVEVFDMESDIVIYDMEKEELFTCPLLNSTDNLETFPTFSPDGRHLYFCSAPAKQMPQLFQELKYHLIRISFDPATRIFGQTPDTLYHADTDGRSAKFPRISPDGKYLMYTISAYGNFSIWHKDADLRLHNLLTNEISLLPDVNSRDVESYHSWSSNSRWFVFSSRREDGLYTHPYICYIDENGKTGKPFLLPQQKTDYYDNSLFSFNIPEFVNGKVDVSSYKLIQFTLSHINL